MTVSKLTTYSEKWVVPEFEMELPGQLIIDKNNCTQFLKLYSKVDFDGIQFSSQKYSPRQYKTISSNTNSFNKITLSDCSFKSAKHFADDIYEITYVPVFFFWGGCFNSVEDSNIFELSCSFPFLSSWYDTDRLFFGSHYYTGNIEEDQFSEFKPALKKEELIDTIQINDDFSIVIERRYEHDTFSSNNRKSTEIKHFAHFKSNQGKRFSEFKTLAYNFLQLIQLSTGKLSYVNFISAIVRKEDLNIFNKELVTHNGNVFISINHFNNVIKRNRNELNDTDRNHMLFYGGQNHSEKLKEIIVRWFYSIGKYSPVYNIFLETFEWFQNTDAYLTQIMFHNRFLNLVQALESYHKFSYPEIKDENKEEVEIKKLELLKVITNREDFKWLCIRITPRYTTLRKRLNDLLVKRLPDITSELFKNSDDRKGYVSKIKEFRDKLSHGEKIKIEASKISDYYYKTIIILLSCILLSLGFSQDEIKESLFRTIKYNDMIRYIKSKS